MSVNATGRTSTKRKVRKGKIGGQFAWRTIEMMEAPAFCVLSHAATRILNRLEIELAHHGGTENGNLICTYDDFGRYGIHRHSVGPAIRELVALGFIEITEMGRAGVGDFRKPTKYRLTYRPTDYADPTDEWRRVKSAKEAKNIAMAAREAEPQKTDSQCRKPPPVPVSETTTGNANSPVTESALLGPVAESAPLSIFRVGAG